MFGYAMQEGKGARARAREIRFQTAICRKRLEITLSIWHTFSTNSRSLYRLG